jgi:hypothetical protein
MSQPHDISQMLKSFLKKTLPLTRVLQRDYFNVSLSPWLKLPILLHLVQGVFGHPGVLTRPILMLSTDLFM